MKKHWHIITTALILLLAMVFRFVWEFQGGIVLATLFCILTMAFMVSHIIYLKSLWYALCPIGFLLNSIAVLSNNGYMPVKGKDSPDGIWIPLTPESNFQSLCDIYWGMSIGDIMIFAGVISYSIIFLLELRRMNTSASHTNKSLKVEQNSAVLSP